MESLEILECTLRDSSYPIAYQFTAEDTAVIAAGLEDAGFRKIEIGHGLGLGASKPDIGIAAATDEEYLAAAASVLTRAKFGMFFIPGIADRHHLDLAAKYKMDFVRVGTNVTETEQAEEFIKYAKDLGMEVSSNLMKTYALPLYEVLKRAELLDTWGADVICVVDSAGGMLPDEVVQAVRLLKQNVGARIGFHGHNNFQLAIANTLAAIRAGATVVDATLRGMGRSSGNAQTEVIVMVLDKMGIRLGIDFYKTMDLGEKLIGPLAQGRGVDSIELASGYALFHSSFMKIIDRVSQETQVDPRELIIRVSEINKVRVTEELARSVAEKIRREQVARPRSRLQYSFNVESWSQRPREKLGTTELARQIATEMGTISKKAGRCSIFTIALSPLVSGRSTTFPFIRNNSTAIVGNAEVETVDQAVEVAAAVDGLVDFVLVDAGRQSLPHDDMLDAVTAVVKRSRLLTYRDSDAHLDAAEALISQLSANLAGASVAICGLSSFGLKLALRLLERGARVMLWDEDEERAEQAVALLSDWMELSGGLMESYIRRLQTGEQDVNILVGTALRQPVINAALVNCVKEGGIVLDAGVGTLTREAIDKAVSRGLRLYRLDMRAGLSGQITVGLETLGLVTKVIGQGQVAGVDVVAGGMIGKRGMVVLDAIQEPTRVIGIADGNGHLLDARETVAYEETVARVKAELVRRRLP